ncbi:hypothetical protein AC579_8895 [Pseudocercospora musae]|uniref:Uncharacterized protein n=1 Tax=Pseudocercospora musae TaxID=113226 RepID=A0A139I1E9_9PEZI|nr:hypothetical protein AC579_8895 [Pseudocercospora musae]
MGKGSSQLEVAGYKREDLGKAAINAPMKEECHSYIGHTVCTDGKPFDPSRCIKDCEETTRYDAEHLQSRAVCHLVNSYILEKDGKAEGRICSMHYPSLGKEPRHKQPLSRGLKRVHHVQLISLQKWRKEQGKDKSCIGTPNDLKSPKTKNQQSRPLQEPQKSNASNHAPGLISEST